MRVAIVGSSYDSAISNLISEQISKSGHKLIERKKNTSIGSNWTSKFLESVDEADVIIGIVSAYSIRDNSTSMELTAASIQPKISNKVFIPVLVDSVQVPSYIAEYLYVDLTVDMTNGLARLMAELSRRSGTVSDPDPTDTPTAEKQPGRQRQVSELGTALHAGRLTLVCGAGISVGAGVPAWNDLLDRLLQRTLRRLKVPQTQLDDRTRKDLPSIYSALVIGRYLKNNLGNDFLSEVRDALYSTNPKTGDVIDAIVRLSRPERDGEPLDSIITFNFDALIEERLQENGVAHHAIFSEGIRTNPSELPVYHVHGYLPRTGKIPPERGIVFSEDAYHSQFIEPFSWSNLVQLNKLTERTCLLVGISLSDPNLRRLLDVASRKTSDGSINHFIIKKMPARDGKVLGPDDLLMLLDEQDANALGLNVIWVEDFSDIPRVLDEIRAARAPGGATGKISVGDNKR